MDGNRLHYLDMMLTHGAEVRFLQELVRDVKRRLLGMAYAPLNEKRLDEWHRHRAALHNCRKASLRGGEQESHWSEIKEFDKLVADLQAGKAIDWPRIGDLETCVVDIQDCRKHTALY
jgi:hypothetical protein